MKFLDSFTTIRGNDLKWRLIRSGFLLLSFMIHGMGFGIVGPTMLDLQIRTNSSISDVTYIVMGRAAGISIGSFLAGPITSFLDIQLAIALSNMLVGVSSSIIPWPKDVRYTIGSFFITGIGFGSEETCLFLYIFHLWGIEGEPFIQALDFSLGVGASIIPLISREFILPLNGSNPNQWSPDDVQIHWCYDIIAGLAIIIAIIFLCLYKYAPISMEHPSRQKVVKETEEGADGKRKDGANDSSAIEQIERSDHKRTLMVRTVCIFLICCFSFFYFGIEMNFGAYLTPYAVEGPVSMTKSDGALIASLFWIVFTFSKIITIFYIKLIGSRNNLILCVGILILSNIVLIPWYNNATCLWIGTFLVGLGTSSIFASIFGYIELSMKVTPLITSLTLAVGCLGQSIFPIVTSQLFHVNKKIFLWLSFGATIAMALFLALIIAWFNFYAKYLRRQTEGAK